MAQQDDWRTLGRPATFSGAEEDWSEWSFTMRAYMLCLHEHVQQIIEVAEAQSQMGNPLTLAILDAALGAEGTAAARRMYLALVMSCKRAGN